MKRGIGEEETMGPMFPRLHVNDTEKGGPRAPPRNKMALYEQLSIPSQPYSPGGLPLDSSKSAYLVPSHSSQENEHERGVFFSRQLPPLKHPVEKSHHCTSGSNTPLWEWEVQSKKQTEKEDFRFTFGAGALVRRACPFGNSKERAVSTDDYSKGTSDSLSMDKREGTVKRSDQLLHFKPRENLVNTLGESHKTNIVQLEFRSDSQVDCTVLPGSVIDVDDDSQEDETCKSSQTGEMDHSDELSETSLVEYVSEMEVSPDDVVRMIGQQHFWKARRAIANQQRMLAGQVFELHRLLKVQRLIAASSNENLDGNAYIGKPLKGLSTKIISLEHSVKAPIIDSRLKNASEKPKSRRECIAENDVGNESLSSVQNGSQPYNCKPLSEKQLPTPVKYGSFVSPWCFNQPQGHQWLIPVTSPSEGLLYKPHSGPAVISPVYGGCGTPGSTPMTGNFLAPSYGLPFAPPTYFRPFGMPFMNPTTPSPAQYRSNQVAATHFQGQLSGGRAGFNIQHWNSINVGSENDGTVPEVVILFPSRDSELQASTANSPSERARGVDMDNSMRRSAFHLFPASPAVDNPVIRPQPCFPERPVLAIKAIPHNARSATESVARIFQSIQEERKQC